VAALAGCAEVSQGRRMIHSQRLLSSPRSPPAGGPGHRLVNQAIRKDTPADRAAPPQIHDAKLESPLRAAAPRRLSHSPCSYLSWARLVRAGADGLVPTQRAGRGRRATRALVGAVPRRSGHDQSKPGRVVPLADGGRGRPGRARSCGRPALPAVVPAAAGTPAARILPSQTYKRLFCPSGSRFGWHHRRPAAVSVGALASSERNRPCG
jgi:hypothetical protein